MRIIHLSDIHLSESNYLEFKNNYLNALIKDLLLYNRTKKIDIIVITGDLVDKGGDSLYKIDGYEDKAIYPSPYDIFEEIFISPIISALGLSKENFLFIPGNHDIDESGILLKEESDLIKNINIGNTNNYLKENLTLKHSNRIKLFKEFESRFHNTNPNYIFSNNQSTYIYEYNGIAVGFLLVNDSWRCKSIKLHTDSKLFLGMQQLYDGLKSLQTNNTILNVLLFHHSIDDFIEKDDIEGFLMRSDIEILLYGHYHSNKTNVFYSSNGNCLGFRSRTSLLNPNEINPDFKSGYQVFDIDLGIYKIIEVHYRVYNNKPDSKSFIPDNTIVEGGIDKNKTNNFKGFDLYRENRTPVLSKTLNPNQFKSI